MAPMEALDMLSQQFLAGAQDDFMARMATGELDTEDKRKKLLDAYAEELFVEVCVVCLFGCGGLMAWRLVKIGGLRPVNERCAR